MGALYAETTKMLSFSLKVIFLATATSVTDCPSICQSTIGFEGRSSAVYRQILSLTCDCNENAALSFQMQQNQLSRTVERSTSAFVSYIVTVESNGLSGLVHMVSTIRTLSPTILRDYDQ